MDTAVRTPQEIFNLPQSLVVPLFQRPYVWDEEHQWTPLWQDVRRMAEVWLGQPGSQAAHFLGAVVLQAQPTQVGTLSSRHIIDGQQRLTTIQLLMDATAAVLEEAGQDHLSQRLVDLTHNSAHFVAAEPTALKLRHTNRDHAAFDEVMNAEPPIDYDGLKNSGSRIVRAHQYFAGEVRTWLGMTDHDGFPLRCDVLVGVLTRGLQLVAIDLRNDENSQEIFETLNARGTPLTAADLIKNFVFQRLAAEGVDTNKAYDQDWPFDTAYWEEVVSVGRYFLSRSSLFLGQWLGARTGEEISPRTTFSRFKHYVEHESDPTMAALLREINGQARQYRAWAERAAHTTEDLDPVALNVYRMRALDMETLKPLLIWLHERPRDSQVVHDVIAAAESWIVRRALLRLPSADLGRIVADLINEHRDVSDGELTERVRRYLSELDVASTYWPGDDEVRRHLLTESAYQRYRRPRLRMFLEAVEDHLRGYPNKPMAGGRVPRKDFHIEHVLPRKWEPHWPKHELAEQLTRREHVHRIGNLTLLTGRLNASVSNGPWVGEKGKRQKLDDHDVFLMNRRIRNVEGWDEDSIDRRTADVVEALLSTWSVPDGHLGEVRDRKAPENPDITVAHLVATGALQVGTELRPRDSRFGDARAVVTEDGKLEVNGQAFGTPSGAGQAVRGSATNGWQFWQLPDGRRLAQLRANAASTDPNSGHNLVESPSLDSAATLRIISGGERLATAVERPGFTVLAGSRARRWRTAEASPSSYSGLQGDLERDGLLVDSGSGMLVFVYDHEFASPSAAASVVLGRSANGRKEWSVVNDPRGPDGGV